jgi:hypothetical protein
MTQDIPHHPSAITALEEQIAFCLEQARANVAYAATIDPVLDQYGHARENAHTSALRYLRMSARLGEALGKMSTTRTTNINVTRREEVPVIVRPRHVIQQVPVTPAHEARVTRIYEEWQRSQTSGVEAIEGEGDDGEGEGV